MKWNHYASYICFFVNTKIGIITTKTIKKLENDIFVCVAFTLLRLTFPLVTR